MTMELDKSDKVLIFGTKENEFTLG
jgi:hypothetical protein